MVADRTKTKCDRCGTCCTKGGPALHFADRDLLTNKHLSMEHLITIRKGEPVLSPFAENPEPAQTELVKIKGRGNKWLCFFFAEKEAHCAIYNQRPLECSLLKCWDTADMERVAGENLLSRYDILPPNDPLAPLIKVHDEQCALDELPRMLTALSCEKSRQMAISDLTVLVNNDLDIRAQACAELSLNLDLELFIFGRPLFIILDQFGIRMHEEKGSYCLTYGSPASSARSANP